jgi:hypothetical protein
MVSATGMQASAPASALTAEINVIMGLLKVLPSRLHDVGPVSVRVVKVPASREFSERCQKAQTLAAGSSPAHLLPTLLSVLISCLISRLGMSLKVCGSTECRILKLLFTLLFALSDSLCVPLHIPQWSQPRCDSRRTKLQ